MMHSGMKARMQGVGVRSFRRCNTRHSSACITSTVVSRRYCKGRTVPRARSGRFSPPPAAIIPDMQHRTRNIRPRVFSSGINRLPREDDYGFPLSFDLRAIYENFFNPPRYAVSWNLSLPCRSFLDRTFYKFSRFRPAEGTRSSIFSNYLVINDIFSFCQGCNVWRNKRVVPWRKAYGRVNAAWYQFLIVVSATLNIILYCSGLFFHGKLSLPYFIRVFVLAFLFPSMNGVRTICNTSCSVP